MQIRALVGEANSDHGIVLDQRRGDRATRPNLDLARCGELFTDPLIELAERHDEAIMLGEKTGDVGQLDGVIAKGQDLAECADELVGSAQSESAPTGADGIE